MTSLPRLVVVSFALLSAPALISPAAAQTVQPAPAVIDASQLAGLPGPVRDALLAAMQSGDPQQIAAAINSAIKGPIPPGVGGVGETDAQIRADWAAQIAGAMTAADPALALTIAEDAARAYPPGAAQIAVAVYLALPSNLQDPADKILIANAVILGAGSDSTAIVTAALNPLVVNALLTNTLPPGPPPPPPPNKPVSNS
ncbi:MAG TPA: hypothetical protein VFC38_06290 [Stellaceae bacterium]|nr:hypothetical protein [Stellaceae bacterium]